MNILVTGSGCPGWYSVYALLQEWGQGPPRYVLSDFNIYGCDAASLPSGSRLAKNYRVLSGSDDGYADGILKIVRCNKIKVLLPLTDPELIPLAKRRSDFFDEGCQVLVSQPGVLAKVLNKERLYHALGKWAPRYLSTDSIEEAADFALPQGSCFVKLIEGYGSRGTKEVLSGQEWLQGFYSKKPEAFGGTIPWKALADLLRGGRRLLLVETLPGAEYSVDCVFDQDGELTFYAVRERETTRGGICQTAKLVPDTSLEFYAVISDIQKALPLRYNINIQLKRDADQNLRLLEINPRVSGSIGAWRPAGYNLIGMTMSLLKGMEQTWELTPQAYDISRSFRVSHFI